MDLPRVVYALRHNPTGKVYVGLTKHILRRIKSHLYSLRSGKHIVGAMQSDFYEYGDDYSVFILDLIETQNDAYKEYMWMDALNSRNVLYGYNKQENADPTNLSKFDELHIPPSFVGFGHGIAWDGTGWPKMENE